MTSQKLDPEAAELSRRARYLLDCYGTYEHNSQKSISRRILKIYRFGGVEVSVDPYTNSLEILTFAEVAAISGQLVNLMTSVYSEFGDGTPVKNESNLIHSTLVKFRQHMVLDDLAIV